MAYGLRGWLFTGFPWLSLGYSQVDSPLGAWAPVAGTYGTTLVVALIAGALVTLAKGSSWTRSAPIVLPKQGWDCPCSCRAHCSNAMVVVKPGAR